MKQKVFSAVRIIALMLCTVLFSFVVISCSEEESLSKTDITKPVGPEGPTSDNITDVTKNSCNWLSVGEIQASFVENVLNLKAPNNMAISFYVTSEKTVNKDSVITYVATLPISIDNCRAVIVEDINALAGQSFTANENKFTIGSSVMNITLGTPEVEDITFRVKVGEDTFEDKVFSAITVKIDQKLCFPEILSEKLTFGEKTLVEGTENVYSFKVTLEVTMTDDKKFSYEFELIATESQKDEVALVIDKVKPLEGSKVEIVISEIHTLKPELNKKDSVIVDVASSLAALPVDIFAGNTLALIGQNPQAYVNAGEYGFAFDRFTAKVNASLTQTIQFEYKGEQMTATLPAATVRMSDLAGPEIDDTSSTAYTRYTFRVSFGLYVGEVLFRSATMVAEGRVDKDQDKVTDTTIKNIIVHPDGTVDFDIVEDHTIIEDVVIPFRGIALNIILNVTENFDIVNENEVLTLTQTSETYGTWGIVGDFNQSIVIGKKMKQTNSFIFNQYTDTKVELTMNRNLTVKHNGKDYPVDLGETTIKTVIAAGEKTEDKKQIVQLYNVVYNVYVKGVKMTVSSSQSAKIRVPKKDAISGYDLLSEVIAYRGNRLYRDLSLTEIHTAEDSKTINLQRDMNMNFTFGSDVSLTQTLSTVDVSLTGMPVTYVTDAIADGNYTGSKTKTTIDVKIGTEVRTLTVELDGILNYGNAKLMDVKPEMFSVSTRFIGESSDPDSKLKTTSYVLMVSFNVGGNTIELNANNISVKVFDYTNLEEYGPLDPDMFAFGCESNIYQADRRNSDWTWTMFFQKGMLATLSDGTKKFYSYASGFTKPQSYGSLIWKATDWNAADMRALVDFGKNYTSGWEYLESFAGGSVSTISSGVVANMGLKTPLRPATYSYDTKSGVATVTLSNGKVYYYK